MAYTVKQVAAMSGVSVRTLHFYDETGLLKPSYHGANRYRYYEEAELLTLQQILFYGKDTNGAICAFESNISGWPKHLHLKQDEWIYILEGDFEFRIGDK
jgi:hypothetical protein